jgi:anti-sigma factor RsiW
MTMRDDPGTPSPPDGLTEAILRATSGPACAAAETRLCGFVDEDLPEIDRELVARHLAACAACAALASALRMMRSALPALAVIDPGPGFAGSVAARTAHLVRRRLSPAARLAHLADEWLQRPRIAFESAYVGAFALMLVFGTPISPLAGVPREALAAAARNPVAGVLEPISRVEDRFSGEVRDVLTAARDSVAATSVRVAGSLAGRPGSVLRRWTRGLAGLFFEDEPTEPPAGAARHEGAEHDDNGDRSPGEGSRLDGVEK